MMASQTSLNFDNLLKIYDWKFTHKGIVLMRCNAIGPCVTTGCPKGPSQQSNSMQRHPLNKI